MTKFVNNGDAIDLYFPAGHPESLQVESGQVVDLGDLKVEEGDDCWLVGEGDEVRAWSKDRWEKQEEKKSAKPAAKDDKSAEKPADKSADKSGE
jgi:hypothetical protein